MPLLSAALLDEFLIKVRSWEDCTELNDETPTLSQQ